jgi:hypothetical protein
MDETHKLCRGPPDGPALPGPPADPGSLEAEGSQADARDLGVRRQPVAAPSSF